MQSIRFVKWLIMIIIIVSVLASACSSQNATEPEPAPPGQVAENGDESVNGSDNMIPAEVDEIYTARCIHCHGNDLQGRMGANSNLQQVGARLSQDEIAETIRNGRDLMPSFASQLSDDEISTLAEWLATKK